MSASSNPFGGGGGGSALDSAMEALKRELSKGTISKTPSPGHTSDQPSTSVFDQQQQQSQQQQQQQQNIARALPGSYQQHHTQQQLQQQRGAQLSAVPQSTASSAYQNMPGIGAGAALHAVNPGQQQGLPAAAVAAQAVRRASLTQQQRPVTPPPYGKAGGVRSVGGNRIAVSIDMLEQVVKGYVASSAHPGTREAKQGMLDRLNRLTWSTHNKNIQQEVVAIIGMPALQAALRSVNLLQGPSVPPRQLAAAAAAAAAANMRHMRASSPYSPYPGDPTSPQPGSRASSVAASQSGSINTRGGITASSILRRPMPMNPVEKERHLARAVCMGGDVKVLAGIDVGYEQALLRLMYGDEEPSALTTASKSSNPRKKRPAILPAEPMDKRQRLALPLSMMEGHNGEYLDKVPLAEDTVKRRLISRTAYRGGVSKEACNAIKAVACTLISSLAGLILEDKKNLDAAKHRCSQSSMMQDDVSGSLGGSGSCTKVVTAKDRSTSSSSSIQLREVSTVGGTAHSTAATRSMVNGQSMMDVTTPIMSIFNYPHKMDDFDGAKESSLLDCSVDTDILMGQDDRITAAHVYYTLNLIQGRFSGPCTLRQLPLKLPRQFWPVWLARAHHKLIQLYIRQSSITDIATQPPLPLSSSSSTSSFLGASGAAGGIG